MDFELVNRETVKPLENRIRFDCRVDNCGLELMYEKSPGEWRYLLSISSDTGKLTITPTAGCVIPNHGLLFDEDGRIVVDK